MNTLSGLSSKEEFNLQRSMGNQRSGFSPLLTPLEVRNLLIKANENGSNDHDIAKFLKKHDCVKTEASGYTMIRRTKSIFKNLDERLHEKVAYSGSTALRNEKVEGFMGFQVSYELSRFEKNLQFEIYNFIQKYDIPWGNVKDIKQLVEIGQKSLSEILESIKMRRGQSDFLVISENIVLKDLSENIYNIKNQEERNIIFKSILQKLNINLNDLSSFHLGSRSYLIKYADKEIKKTNAFIKKLKENILLEIQNYS